MGNDWKEIIKIPKGSTKTYKEIAFDIGKPKSELLSKKIQTILEN